MKSKSFQILFFYSLILLSILLGAQTLWSGYHFVDDHEIVRLMGDFRQFGYFETLTKWITTDFAIRFRPFYFIHRVSQAYLFGTNFSLWSGYLFLWVLATCQLNYLTLKNIRWTTLAAFLMPLFVFLGKASPVIWRLGPSEVYGLTFASLAFYLISRTPHRTFGPILCMITAALFKESFVLSFPFFVFFKIFYANDFDGNIVKSLKENTKFILSCALLSIALLAVIKLFVGTEKIEYAGVSGFTVGKLLETIKSFLQLTYSKYLIFFWLPLLVYFKRKRMISQTRIRQLALAIATLGILALPQLVLYTKSGIFERYLIPVIYSTAILFALPFDILLKKSFSPFRDNFKHKNLFIALGIVLIIISLPTLISEELRLEILAWYSSIKGKPNKPHYNLKLLLTAGTIFLLGAISLLSTLDTLRSKIRSALSATKFNNWPTLLTLILLLASLVDRYFISFRFATDFSNKGKAIGRILSEIKNFPNAEPIAIVFPPEASEVLFSLRAYSKNILNFTNFKYLPFFMLEKESTDLDNRLIKDTLNSFKHDLIDGNEELPNYHAIIVAPEIIDFYAPLLRSKNFTQETEDHFYLFTRDRNE